MKDIVQRLNEWVELNVAELPQLTTDLCDAIAEITYLRSVAGAVSDGMSMADIKARNGRLADSLK